MTTKMKTLLESVLHKSFKFEAKSYEIWQDGCCIRCATCSTCATAEYEDSLFASMKFRLMDNPTYIDNEFSFPLACDDLLEDRVQYGRLSPVDYVSGSSLHPIVCNIFPITGILRFATPNPLRLVEFSGNFLF